MSHKHLNKKHQKPAENVLQDLIRKKLDENKVLQKILDQLSSKKQDIKNETENDH